MTKTIMRSVTPKNRVRVTLDCGDEMLTKQSFKDECNINTVVDRYAKTGQLPQARMEIQYGESPTMDLKEALDTIGEYRESFDSLSDALKERFNGSFDNYVDFMENIELNGSISSLERYFAELDYINESVAAESQDSPVSDVVNQPPVGEKKPPESDG